MIGLKVRQLPASYKKVQEFLEVDTVLELLNPIAKFEAKEQEQLKRILENKILRGDKKVIVKLFKAYEDTLNHYEKVLEDNKEIWGQYEDTMECLDKAREENRMLSFDREFLVEYKKIKENEEIMNDRVDKSIFCYMEMKEIIEEQLKIIQYYWLKLFSEVERKLIFKINKLEEVDYLLAKILVNVKVS